jgi:hypothetical protein
MDDGHLNYFALINKLNLQLDDTTWTYHNNPITALLGNFYQIEITSHNNWTIFQPKKYEITTSDYITKNDNPITELLGNFPKGNYH